MLNHSRCFFLTFEYIVCTMCCMSPVTSISQRRTRRKFLENKPSRGGYSLLEMLMVVMFVALILLAFSTGIFKPASSQGLSTAARDLSNYLTLARAEAVRHQTVVRVVFPMEWPEIDDQGRYNRMGLWKWEAATAKFKQMHNWVKIPDGVVLEPEMPDYVREAGYAHHDGATIRGDYALREDVQPFIVRILESNIATRYIEFLPTGGARMPEGEEKRIILVAVEGFEEPPGSGKIIRTATDGKHATNWAQVNIETLTGKVQIHRP